MKNRTGKNRPQWVLEFGEDWQVPPLIDQMAEAGALIDVSWSNDACPSFSVPPDCGARLALWVEHPAAAGRTDPKGPRFCVHSGPDVGEDICHYKGDDLAEALRVLFYTANNDVVEEPKNPRFVMVVGAIRERFPDIPEYVGENGQLVIWDRQEGIAAVTVSQKYSQALCLEVTTYGAHGIPFTNLERWLNSLNNVELESEGLTATRKEFRS